MAVVTLSYGTQAHTKEPETNDENHDEQAASPAEKGFCSSSAIVSECVVCGVYGTGAINTFRS